jgi:hypothetical protein
MTRISTSRSDRLALHRTVPTQSPIALLREMDSGRPYCPRLRIHQRCAFHPLRPLNPGLIRATVISHTNATAQIAIAHRFC